MPNGVTVCECCAWVTSRDGNLIVVTVVGDLDFGCAAAFAASLAAVANNGCHVVVDMAQVAFMDAASLGALDRVQRLFGILGLGFVVRSPSRWVRCLLGLRDLDGLIEEPGASTSPMFGPRCGGDPGLDVQAMGS